MQILERFMAYAQDFEKTYIDDDWSRITPYFADDAVYEVRGMAPLAMKGEGRDGVAAALKASIDDLDRRCKSRQLELTAPPQVKDQTVTVFWQGVYTIDGGDDLVISGREDAVYNDAGEIQALIDTYDDEAARTFSAWLETHRELLS